MNNKIHIETPLGTKTFKTGDIVQASSELKQLTMLNQGIKMRILGIVDPSRVRVQIIGNNEFTQRFTYKNETGEIMTYATVHYKHNELKRAQFIIGAKYLKKVLVKQRATPNFGF